MTQIALSNRFGLSESSGRKLIKFFSDYIPYTILKGNKLFTEESYDSLKIIMDIKNRGYSKVEILEILESVDNIFSIDLDNTPYRTLSNSLSQSALSSTVGWSEARGRSWIKSFDEFFQYEVRANVKYFNEEAVDTLMLIRKINDLGYAKDDVKEILTANKGLTLATFSTLKLKNKRARTSVTNYDKGLSDEIPPRSELMLAILEVLKDKQPCKTTEITDRVAVYLQLSEELQSMKDEANKEFVFVSRLRSARGSLKNKAYIVETTKYTYQITDTGLELLSEDEDDIDEEIEELDTFVDPFDTVEENVKEIQHQLVNDLLNVIQTIHWRRLEVIVVELLESMGYGKGEVTQRTRDGGFDGMVLGDEFGFDRIYIQSKRYKKSRKVSASEVRDFSGTLDSEGSKKGIIITTSSYSREATNYINKLKEKHIELIDGERLAKLLIRHKIGVKIRKKIIIQSIDDDYFTGEE